MDHMQQLTPGGEDTDGNVQALCRPCHKAKTRQDLRAVSTPL
ncbi:HNH endonuclease [Streptomyces sp. NPDC058409]